MFTDPNQSRKETDSPVSIGEEIDGSQQKDSNPFRPIDPEKAKWEEERKMFFTQMNLMKQQLDSEKTARIESQVSVEGCDDGISFVGLKILTKYLNLSHEVHDWCCVHKM